MVAVNYLWNPINDNIVREFDDAGNSIAEYSTEPGLYGNVISQSRGGQTSYLHFDAQGNTTELTNDAGEVTDRIRYSAFGEVTERTGSTEIPFQYVGQKGYYSDAETGSHSIRQRPLVTQYARWLSRDPARDTLNEYPYVVNSPLTLIDASGLKCVVCGWKGPFITGTIDPHDTPLTDPIHRRGVDSRLGHLNDTFFKGKATLSLRKYGPFSQTLKPTDLLFFGACWAYEAEICGDSCTVNIIEDGTNATYDPGRKKWDKKDFRDEIFKDLLIGSPVDDDLEGVLLVSEFKNPRSGYCDKVMVITDCPAVIVDAKKGEWWARLIKQSVWISDGPLVAKDESSPLEHWLSSAYFQSHFHLYYKGTTSDPLPVLEVQNTRSRTLGEPTECC